MGSDGKFTPRRRWEMKIHPMVNRKFTSCAYMHVRPRGGCNEGGNLKVCNPLCTGKDKNSDKNKTKNEG